MNKLMNTAFDYIEPGLPINIRYPGPVSHYVQHGETERTYILRDLTCGQYASRAIFITIIAISSFFIIPAVLFAHRGIYRKTVKWIIELKLGKSIEGKYDESPNLNLKWKDGKKGNHWLSEIIRKHIWDLVRANQLGQPLNLKSDDEICFAHLHDRCRKNKNWDLNTHFPGRMTSVEEVSKLSVQQLLELPSIVFFTIIDLINGEQALQILDSKADGNRKMGLYYYNENLGKAMLGKLNTESNVSITQRVQDIVKRVATFQKYSPQEFEGFMGTEKYEALDSARLDLSTTYQREKEERWAKLNNEYLINGVQSPITSELLNKINAALRPKPNFYVEHDRILGLRPPKYEASNPETEIFYFPGSVVSEAFENFITQLNEKLKQCEGNVEESIILAGRTYQFFLSIHPFADGNGRTARLLSDMILRSVGLLPAAPEDPCAAIFLAGKNKGETPSDAVELIALGIERAYQIVATPLDNIDSEGDEKAEAESEEEVEYSQTDLALMDFSTAYRLFQRVKSE